MAENGLRSSAIEVNAFESELKGLNCRTPET
jgi:hypothetical protein